MGEARVGDRGYWTSDVRRLGTGSALALVVVGVLYVATIALWLVVEATPLEPIGDPYLAVMEVLTIVSALALVGLVVAIRRVAHRERSTLGVATLLVGIAAAVVTIAVHFVQLTAIRQLWRVGELPDYRLVWPSAILAVEYFAWDILVGATMVLISFALAGGPWSVAARRTMLSGGVLCLAGVVGPASGQMLLQNIAVTGYAIFLPIGCALLVRVLRAPAP